MTIIHLFCCCQVATNSRAFPQINAEGRIKQKLQALFFWLDQSAFPALISGKKNILKSFATDKCRKGGLSKNFKLYSFWLDQSAFPALISGKKNILKSFAADKCRKGGLSKNFKLCSFD
jgi:hypothetical protein